jgi:catechol 2,3-dioxygenase-like lactoylglutathione lyase family enzyme
MLGRAVRVPFPPLRAAFPAVSASLPMRYHTHETRRMAASTAKSLDHLVLTVKDIPATIKWYEEMLNMSHTSFTSGGVERHALKFGDQKINLHQSGKEFEPKAQTVQPGSGDICFLVEDRVDDVLARLQSKSIQILEGETVVERTGARGRLRSVYVRDPDGNLIE